MKTSRLLYRHPVKVSLGLALGGAAALCVALGLATGRVGHWTAWLAYWLVAVNIVALGTYWVDKQLARRTGFWRVPERTLLSIAFVGGTLGAWIGMRVFRHKTLKGSFRLAFWAMGLVQLLFVIAAIVAAARSGGG